MNRVLLVTGSRSLARIEGAEAWTRALIRAAELAERAGITAQREVWR